MRWRRAVWERRARPGVPEGEATGVPFPGVKGHQAASASVDSPALPGAACPGSTSAAAAWGSAAWEGAAVGVPSAEAPSRWAAAGPGSRPHPASPTRQRENYPFLHPLARSPPPCPRPPPPRPSRRAPGPVSPILASRSPTWRRDLCHGGEQGGLGRAVTP